MGKSTREMKRCIKPAWAALGATTVGASALSDRCRCEPANLSCIIPACAAGVSIAGVGWYLYSREPSAGGLSKSGRSSASANGSSDNAANELFESAQQMEGLATGSVGSTQPTNLKQAVKLYEAAVELGHPGAQARLGFLAANGFGLKRDLPRAVSLYTSSAEAGDAGAQFALSVLYMTGRGVEKNFGVSRAWAQKAADQGHDGAMISLSGSMVETTRNRANANSKRARVSSVSGY